MQMRCKQSKPYSELVMFSCRGFPLKLIYTLLPNKQMPMQRCHRYIYCTTLRSHCSKLLKVKQHLKLWNYMCAYTLYF